MMSNQLSPQNLKCLRDIHGHQRAHDVKCLPQTYFTTWCPFIDLKLVGAGRAVLARVRIPAKQNSKYHIYLHTSRYTGLSMTTNIKLELECSPIGGWCVNGSRTGAMSLVPITVGFGWVLTKDFWEGCKNWDLSQLYSGQTPLLSSIILEDSKSTGWLDRMSHRKQRNRQNGQHWPEQLISPFPVWRPVQSPSNSTCFCMQVWTIQLMILAFWEEGQIARSWKGFLMRQPRGRGS